MKLSDTKRVKMTNPLLLILSKNTPEPFGKNFKN